LGLGAQAGEERLRDVFTEAGSHSSGVPLRHRSTWSSKPAP